MSKDELMSVNNQPEQEPGTVTNIMRRHDMRKTVVTVNFKPKKASTPEHRPRRWEFATVVLANEFIEKIVPSERNRLGSPKQFRLKRAAMLRVAPSVIDQYDITASLEITGNQAVGVDQPTSTDDLDTFVEGSDVETLEIDIDELIQPAGDVND